MPFPVGKSHFRLEKVISSRKMQVPVGKCCFWSKNVIFCLKMPFLAEKCHFRLKMSFPVEKCHFRKKVISGWKMPFPVGKYRFRSKNIISSRGWTKLKKTWLKLGYKFGSTMFQPKTAKFGKNLVLGWTIFFLLQPRTKFQPKKCQNLV